MANCILSGNPAVARKPPAIQELDKSLRVAVDEAAPGSEAYEAIRENPFVTVVEQPLSTFALGVDTATYSNVRRFLEETRWPPPDSVRLEGLVNYFPFDYPRPTGDDRFSLVADLSDCPWSPAHQLLRVAVQGQELDPASLPPSNLVFLIDVSGSMETPNKLPLVKRAFRLLVPQLSEQDRVSIVVYAGKAGLVLPPTSGDRHDAIRAALDALEAGGSTAGGQGIELAYGIAEAGLLQGGNNRVILVTDGDFNVGISSDDALVRLIEDRKKTGIFLTIVGFGVYNYKDAKLEKLARHGNGNYAYVDRLEEANKVFVRDLRQTLFTIAKDVKIQLELNPVHVESYRLLGYERRQMAARDFRDDTKDGGEVGSGSSVTVLYELVPPRSGSGAPRLKYQKRKPRKSAMTSGELATVRIRYKDPNGDRSREISRTVAAKPVPLDLTPDHFRFPAAVAQFALLLRKSEHMGQSSFESVLDLAKGALGEDPDGYRAEFVRMVEKARLLLITH